MGIKLQHVKAHGALYNQAVKNNALAVAIAQAVKDAGEGLILLGLANSEFDKAAAEVGVPYAAEAFADRAYQADGTLVPVSYTHLDVYKRQLLLYVGFYTWFFLPWWHGRNPCHA